MSIANTQTIVNSYNNWIVISGTTFTLPVGDYDAYALASALTSATGRSFAYSNITLKITMTSATSCTVSGPIATELLGFTDGATGTSISSVNTVSLTGTQAVYVDTDLSGGNVCVRTSGSTNTCLARLNMDVQPLAVLHWQDSGSDATLIADPIISTLNISLSDEKCRPLLVTIPYSLSMQFTPVYTGRETLRIDRPSSMGINPPPSAK